jgi:hypothetical protein
MDMPEGFKTLNYLCEHPDIHPDVAKARDLLQEMAEALEEVEDGIGYEGGLYSYYPSISTDDPKYYPSIRVQNVLKKFKEWK